MPSFHSSFHSSLAERHKKKVRKSTYFLILFDDALQARLSSWVALNYRTVFGEHYSLNTVQ